MFFNENTIKLETNNCKISGRLTSIEKSRNILQNNL